MNILDTKNSTNPIDNLRKTSEAILNSAEQAVGSTAAQAGEALHNRIDPMVDLMAVTAQKLAKQSMDMASDAKEYAQHAINRASKASTQYVSEQPVRSVLMAAAVGAAVAVLITSMRSHNDVRRY